MAAVDVPAQHEQAMELANRVRLARAELKRKILAGETTVSAVLRSVPWEAETMTIFDLLMAQHRWGRARCRRFLISCASGPHQGSIAETKPLLRSRVGGMSALTERQRLGLAERLEELGPTAAWANHHSADVDADQA